MLLPRKPRAYASLRAFCMITLRYRYSPRMYMYPVCDPTASAAIMTPSMTEWGSCSKISRSLQVPGSLSSPLHNTYLGLGDCLGTNDHFIPVLKPAPPRPRRPEFLISLMIASDSIASAFCTAL